MFCYFYNINNLIVVKQRNSRVVLNEMRVVNDE